MKQTKMLFLLFFEIELEVFITYGIKDLYCILINYTATNAKGLSKYVSGRNFQVSGRFLAKTGKTKNLPETSDRLKFNYYYKTLL
jgi:hypothetical protein